MTEEARLYIVAFRAGHLIAILILVGDSALSDEQVFGISLAAVARVDGALRRRGSEDTGVGCADG